MKSKKQLKRTLGFATGCLFREFQSISNEAINICLSTGGDAIELTCLKKKQIPLLWNIDMQALMRLEHVSIHMPTDIYYDKNNPESLDALKLLTDFCKANRSIIEIAVFHPDCVVSWEIIEEFSRTMPVAIENMDNRKNSFRDEKDLKTILYRYPNFVLVFDLNHWISNGYSPRSAIGFMREFKDEIREIHLSGHWDYHDPIIHTLQTNLIMIASESDSKIPIIIESVVNKDEIQSEFDLISKYLY